MKIPEEKINKVLEINQDVILYVTKKYGNLTQLELTLLLDSLALNLSDKFFDVFCTLIQQQEYSRKRNEGPSRKDE